MTIVEDSLERIIFKYGQNELMRFEWAEDEVEEIVVHHAKSELFLRKFAEIFYQAP